MTKNSSKDTPIITSGMTSGSKNMPPRICCERRASHSNPIAAGIPRLVATIVDTTATTKLFHVAAWSARSSINWPYQCHENPCQVDAKRDALKEKTNSTRMGRYKNRTLKTATDRSHDSRRFTTPSPSETL